VLAKLKAFYDKSFLARLVAYMGPALIVSMAYMDPGNYGTALEGGAQFGYSLIWVVWLASGMAMLLQYLSGKLGIATGNSLPELVREKLQRRAFVVSYWLAAEAAIAATDLAEFLGTVIALNLLFGVPLLYAAVFGAADVVIILALTTRRFRVLEQLFMLWVSIIGIGYLYEMVVVHPNTASILYNSIVPSFVNQRAVLVAVGIIGATVMPHALFVHSAFTAAKSKLANIDEKKKARRLHLVENVVLLVIAAFVNGAIMITAAAAFYPEFSHIASISEAYRTLIPLFGIGAGAVFVVTLLFSGIASSVTGTLAGQVVMEGLLGRKTNPWIRRIITRFVNVIPTTIAILIGLDPLSILVYSQVILSIMIPLPLIPLLLLTRDRKIMGEFVNRKATTLMAMAFVAIITIFDAYLILETIVLR
jgi:manganese transport protein